MFYWFKTEWNVLVVAILSGLSSAIIVGLFFLHIINHQIDAMKKKAVLYENIISDVNIKLLPDPLGRKTVFGVDFSKNGDVEKVQCPVYVPIEFLCFKKRDR